VSDPLLLLKLRQAQERVKAGLSPTIGTGADQMRERGLTSPDPSGANAQAEAAITADGRSGPRKALPSACRRRARTSGALQKTR
jgi:hypothetical protein